MNKNDIDNMQFIQTRVLILYPVKYVTKIKIKGPMNSYSGVFVWMSWLWMPAIYCLPIFADNNGNSET